jgi:hypothetical protein
MESGFLTSNDFLVVESRDVAEPRVSCWHFRTVENLFLSMRLGLPLFLAWIVALCGESFGLLQACGIWDAYPFWFTHKRCIIWVRYLTGFCDGWCVLLVNEASLIWL